MPLAVLIALMLLPVMAEAAEVDRNAHPPVQAVRLTGAVTVDGVLSEEIWQNDHVVTDFKMRDPVEGVSPSERTEVRIAFDDHAIYIAARMYDSKPDSILGRLARRDQVPPSDEFSVMFDPLYDRRTGYYFVINPASVLSDGTLLNDNWDDDSWDGVWQGRAQVDEHGWTAEMRIPFSQMRIQAGAGAKWGVNMRRRILRKSEFDYLVYTPRDGSGFVSRFPDLVGIETNGNGRYVEVRPYVTSKGEFVRHDSGDPFNDGSDVNGDVGGDLRIGVGRNLTLNATVNPDFGQVEVDPAVVNLSDVETFFDEKRPFFVEGSSSFEFGQQGASDYWGFNYSGPRFFYSRRIGRTPQGSLPDHDYADAPLGTTILGAGKLTGRAGGFNVGTLHALTARESAKLQMGTSAFEAEVEPLTYYGIARGQKEFNERRQGLGLMTTLAARSFKDASLRDEVNSHGLMSGLDGWWFLDQEKVWVLSGHAAVSNVAGNRSRMVDLQRSSRRYYQRPDAGHVSVDTNATSLSGATARVWLNKEKGNFYSNSAIGFISPGFEVNDIGFQTRADQINGHLGGGYKWPKTTSWKKYIDVGGGLYQTRDFDNNVVGKGFWGWNSIEFVNNYSWNLDGGRAFKRDDTRRTRGGPVMVAPGINEIGMYLDGDGKQKFFWYLNMGGARDDEGSWSTRFNPGIELKPMSNLSIELGPEIERSQEKAQYVRTVTDPTATSTFGARYVFGNLEQTTVSANIRFNVSFTPNLSLQTFVQPLISAGHYTAFKELAAPRTYEFNEYGQNGSTYDPNTGMVDPDGPGGPAAPFTIRNPDFNFKSLRGNAVLRWEYMPGSTFFLVWTQSREHFEERGDFAFGRDYNQLLDSQGDNIFLAKVTYYFTL
jgi:hypothetical protein